MPGYLHEQIDRLPKLEKLAALMLQETPKALEARRGQLLERPDSRHVGLARLAGVKPTSAASKFVQGITLRGDSDSQTSPNVPTRPDNHGQFAALVLHGSEANLVSPRDAAVRLGVNRETIYRLCSRGELAHVRVGSALRIDLAASLAQAPFL